MRPLTLSLLGDRFAIVRLPPTEPVPAWALDADGLVSITRTGDELSIVISESALAAQGRHWAAEGGWAALKVHGPLPFAQVGVLASLASPLADEGVSLFAISTYDTDVVLVKAAQLATALAALARAGHAHAPAPRPGLRVERRRTEALSRAEMGVLHALCDAAYEEDSAAVLRDVGPGEHLLAWDGDALVSHLMWVDRTLECEGRALRTAYVELVATDPAVQQRGYASHLLAHLPGLLREYDLAVLSPATERIYLRQGWTWWQGPLRHRDNGELVADADERVMYLRLPPTPRTLDPTAPLIASWRPGDIW